MGEETELKLSGSRSSLAKIAGSSKIRKKQAAASRVTDIISIYYDTRRRDLQKRGITFRLRRQGDEYLQTVKADVDRFPSRKEWECKIADRKPDFAATKGTALEPLLSKKLRRRLKPVFETRVQRTAIPLDWGKSKIELSVDRGKLKANGSTVPISEIELELKDGQPSDLFAAARSIARLAPLRMGMLSKAEVGYELADDKLDRPFRTTPIVLSRKLTAADVFREIVHACLRHVVANEAAVQAGHSEGVHQMRIGLRRLRTALAIFSELIDQDPPVVRIKHGLKWITKELGPARDLDVYLHKSVAPLERGKEPVADSHGLKRITERSRKAAFARASGAVESPRYRAVILDIVDWLNTGAWLAKGNTRRDRPIVDFVEDEIARRWKKIAKKKKKFDGADARELHKIRIAAKKLRYASEFFATIFPGHKQTKRRRTFAKALKQLQSSLGDLNDFNVHSKLADHLVLAKNPGGRGKPRRRRAFAAGMIAGKERVHSRKLLKKARQALREVAAVKNWMA